MSAILKHQHKIYRPVTVHATIPNISVVQLTQGYVALIDTDVAHDVGKHNWSAYNTLKSKNIYARRRKSKFEGGGTEVLHKFLWRLYGYPTVPEIDHVDTDSLNNTKLNLRAATHRQNKSNINKQANNTSGYKGVWLDKRYDRWVAEITCNGSKKFLGWFTSKEDAAKTYDAAAIKYHKEFANLNFKTHAL